MMKVQILPYNIGSAVWASISLKLLPIGEGKCVREKSTYLCEFSFSSGVIVTYTPILYCTEKNDKRNFSL